MRLTQNCKDWTTVQQLTKLRTQNKSLFKNKIAYAKHLGNELAQMGSGGEKGSCF